MCSHAPRRSPVPLSKRPPEPTALSRTRDAPAESAAPQCERGNGGGCAVSDVKPVGGDCRRIIFLIVKWLGLGIMEFTSLPPLPPVHDLSDLKPTGSSSGILQDLNHPRASLAIQFTLMTTKNAQASTTLAQFKILLPTQPWRPQSSMWPWTVRRAPHSRPFLARRWKAGMSPRSLWTWSGTSAACAYDVLTTGASGADFARSSSSNKFFFTVDGKSRIDDTTTLGYYMSLSAEVCRSSSPHYLDTIHRRLNMSMNRARSSFSRPRPPPRPAQPQAPNRPPPHPVSRPSSSRSPTRPSSRSS